MFANLSLKAVPPIAIALAAAIALAIITGDKEYLALILLGLVQSGGSILTPPAPGIKQEDVAALAEIKAGSDDLNADSAAEARGAIRSQVANRKAR